MLVNEMKLVSERAKKAFENLPIEIHDEAAVTVRYLAACLWDVIDSIPTYAAGPRLVAIAKTDLESSVMWALKALSQAEAEEKEQHTSA